MCFHLQVRVQEGRHILNWVSYLLERANLSHWITPVGVRIILTMAVYRQSLRLGDKPLETHNQNIYFPNAHVRL
jgi:hypothetical protein